MPLINMDGYLTKKMFWTVFIPILVAVLGYVIGTVEKTRDTFNHNVTEIKTDVATLNEGYSGIKDDISEVKDDISEIKGDIKMLIREK